MTDTYDYLVKVPSHELKRSKPCLLLPNVTHNWCAPAILTMSDSQCHSYVKRSQTYNITFHVNKSSCICHHHHYAQCHCLPTSQWIQTVAYYLTVQVIVGVICELVLPAASLTSPLVRSALWAREPAHRQEHYSKDNASCSTSPWLYMSFQILCSEIIRNNVGNQHIPVWLQENKNINYTLHDQHYDIFGENHYIF